MQLGLAAGQRASPRSSRASPQGRGLTAVLLDCAMQRSLAAEQLGLAKGRLGLTPEPPGLTPERQSLTPGCGRTSTGSRGLAAEQLGLIAELGHVAGQLGLTAGQQSLVAEQLGLTAEPLGPATGQRSLTKGRPDLALGQLRLASEHRPCRRAAGPCHAAGSCRGAVCLVVEQLSSIAEQLFLPRSSWAEPWGPRAGRRGCAEEQLGLTPVQLRLASGRGPRH